MTGAGPVRSRLQAATAQGLTRFVGRDTELDQLRQALERAGTGQGQVMAVIGEPGVGKSRLFWEFMQSHRTQGWLQLESRSVSYGKATAYLPVCDLLKAYCHIEDRDDLRTVRAKVAGRWTWTKPSGARAGRARPVRIPAATVRSCPGPPAARRRTLDALKRLLLRESQVQPLLLVFEDLHWIDTETQAMLDLLVESLPTALRRAMGSVWCLSARGRCSGRSLCWSGPGVCARTGTFRSCCPSRAGALGVAYALDGRVAAGLALVEHGVEQLIARGRPWRLALLVTWLSEAYLLAGRLEDAHQRAAQAFDLVRQYRQRGHQARVLWLLGESTARQAVPRGSARRRPLPPSPRPGRRARHAPAPGPLPHGLGTLYPK